MAAAKFSVPNKEQEQWIRECDMDPAGYVVRTDSEDMLGLLHLKSRNEVTIVKNRRVNRDN